MRGGTAMRVGDQKADRNVCKESNDWYRKSSEVGGRTASEAYGPTWGSRSLASRLP